MTLREWCREYLAEKAQDEGRMPEESDVQDWIESEAEFLGAAMLNAVESYMTSQADPVPELEEDVVEEVVAVGITNGCTVLRYFDPTPEGYKQAVEFISTLEGAENGIYFLDAPESLASEVLKV